MNPNTPFRLEKLDPETYRHKTRASSLVLIVIFASLAMGCASVFVLLWGQPGSNFRLNLLGVLTGLGLTLALVKFYLSRQPFMREAVYSWRLKRQLMRITNIMHKITPLVEADHTAALSALCFYHRALEQMHYLEGNDVGALELKVEKQQLIEKMQALGLETEITTFDPQWLEQINAQASLKS